MSKTVTWKVAPKGISRIKISPEQAQAIIDRHEQIEVTEGQHEGLEKAKHLQRKLNSNKVDQYAEVMTSKEWVPGVAVIVQSVRGRLLNGQHTLHAIVRSAHAQTVLYVNDISEKDEQRIYDKTDNLKVRNIQDVIYAHNVHIYPSARAAGALAYEFEQDKLMNNAGHRNAGSEELKRYLLDNAPDLNKLLNQAVKFKNIYKITHVAGWMYLILKHTKHRDKMEEFFEILLDGATQNKHSPARQLREWCMEKKKFRTHGHYSTIQFPVGIRAWNAFIEGEIWKQKPRDMGYGDPLPEIL